jgi:glucose-1-phosphate thymidylyltransferase
VIFAVSGDAAPPGRWPLGRPSHLVPVANRPLLLHTLRALGDAGVRRVAVVVDSVTAEGARVLVGDGGDAGVAVHFVEQPAGTGAISGLLAAAEVMGGRPCVVHTAGWFLAGSLRQLVSEFMRRLPDGVVLIGANGPGRGRRRPPQALPVGIDFCRPALLERLSSLIRTGEGEPVEPTLSEALLGLADGGAAVEGWAAPGPAAQVDGPEGILQANRLALEDQQADWEGATLVDSQVEGRVMIAPGAVVRSSIVRGPAVIGRGVELTHAFIGPYSVIGDGSRIEGAEIQNSVLLSDVRINSPGWRLEASVIGSGVRIQRNFELPAGMRLRVGDGALVYVT